MFDPFQVSDSPTESPYPATVDSGAVSTDGSGGFDWGALFGAFPKIANATAGLITASRGRPYTTGPYGISSPAYYGQGGLYGSVGSGGLTGGISGSTLVLLFGAAALFMLARK